MSNFKGGSNGLADSHNQMDNNSLRVFANSEIYPVILRQNIPVKGYIMPDFDRSLSTNDSAFKTSTSPYRCPNMLDSQTNHPAFTSWFVPVKTYLFFASKYHFVSPHQFGEPDPIADLRFHIRDNNLAHYEYLTKRPQTDWKNTPFALPMYDNVKFMNAVCTPTYAGKDGKDTELKPRILALKYTSFEDVAKDLNDGGPRTVSPIDPDWPSYMLGDVTNPDRAVEFRSVSKQMMAKNSNGKYLALEFGNLVQNGTTATLNVITRAFTDSELAARIDLEDENMWYKPTYQEIVDLLLDLGHVPYDLIATVCGDKANVTPRNSTPSYHSNQTAPTQPAPNAATTPTAPMPPTPPAPPAPAAPAAPVAPPMPPKPEREFWIAENGQVSKVLENELVAKVNAGFAGAVMLVGDSAWVTADAYGIVKAAPAAPAAPTAPAAPAAPPAPAPQAAAPSLTPPSPVATEMRTKEEEAEWEELGKRLRESNSDPSKALGTPELRRLGALGRKAAYQG